MRATVFYGLGVMLLFGVLACVKWAIEFFMANDAPLAFLFVLGGVACGWFGTKCLKKAVQQH